LAALMAETLGLSFRLRAAGKRLGAVTRWGGGTWGLLRSLKLEGPQTVPALARARPVARQHIQKLADELAGAGLVAFADNPAHRRSRLVRLTPKGETAFRAMDRRVRAAAEDLAADISEPDVRTALRVLARLRAKLAAGA
jgi:DNA-binding MarR family transcriptional regulator